MDSRRPNRPTERSKCASKSSIAVITPPLIRALPRTTPLAIAQKDHCSSLLQLLNMEHKTTIPGRLHFEKILYTHRLCVLSILQNKGVPFTFIYQNSNNYVLHIFLSTKKLYISFITPEGSSALMKKPPLPLISARWPIRTSEIFIRTTQTLKHYFVYYILHLPFLPRQT